MASSKEPSDVASIEDVIRRLRNVLSVRVIEDGKGEIEEIHVLVDEKRNPKQIGRDIESALMSELHLRVDHRKISIAQVRPGEGHQAGLRLQLTNVSLSVDEKGAQARVTLGREGDTYSGLAGAQRYEYDALALVVSATLNAVAEYLQTTVEEEEARPTIVVKHIAESSDVHGKAVSVSLRLIHAGGDETLLGVALVRQDTWVAAACAALDALNRRLGWFVE
jgi:hypothetical protein